MNNAVARRPSMQTDPPLKKLGRYEITAKIGEGGMGTVFKAFDPVLERPVALKISKHFKGSPADAKRRQVERFMREARLAARFIHPNIAITYDAGFEKGLFYMALEFIDGTGLQAHARPETLLPRSQVVEIIYNVCYALDYIHSLGYVHLDIKPSNIMLTQKGEVKLMDFGITRLMREGSEGGSQLTGSIFYLAPEQIDPNHSLDHRTDVYALGAAFYELLCGRRAYEGTDPYQLLYRISHEPPTPMSEHIPDISPEISAAVAKAMQREPKRRFPSAKAFAEVLLPVIRGKDSLSMDRQDKRKLSFLRQIYLFRHFQIRELKEVIRLSAWNAYKKDTWIIERAQGDSQIHVMIHGNASLHLGGGIKPLRKGEVFGESALVYPMSAAAKVRAESDCIVMSINASLLNQADEALQVKFLKEFYNKKVRQLVEANLRLMRNTSRPPELIPSGNP
jgi:serine/threonine-protein kinase